MTSRNFDFSSVYVANAYANEFWPLKKLGGVTTKKSVELKNQYHF